MAVTVESLGDPYQDGRPPTWRYITADGGSMDVCADTEQEAVASIEASLAVLEDGAAGLTVEQLAQVLIDKGHITQQDVDAKADEVGEIVVP